MGKPAESTACYGLLDTVSLDHEPSVELSIAKSLQQGVAAHKDGNLQDAERFYRAILKIQPEHPDANHNLGVLAVSFNQTYKALPLFKTALKANPKMLQYWISYVDALIKEQDLESAKRVIQLAKERGIDTDSLNSGGTHMILKSIWMWNKSEVMNANFESPS